MYFPIAALSLTAVAASGAYLCLPANLRAADSSGSPTSAVVAVETVSTDFEVPILRSGITPRYLAAAGVSESNVNAVLLAVAEEFDDLAALNSADTAFMAARQAHADLERLVSSGLGDESDATALVAATTTLNSAKATLDSVLSDARAVGAAELTGPQQATLASLIANGDRRLPTEFLVLDLESADWLKLRTALNDEKAAPKLGLDPNAELQSFLTEKRAVTAVATAKANLEANLSAIQSAWDASFAD